ncbi:disease resistance protein Roq1-like [Rosa rugosa]|uniref:disease resistance protein Roq1-like n=1 Tax=Rosa rugosa TaxID=74645 RepID=UPI002B40A2AA|nr:disease resistance protein Roq1-like [Rosa rugosa]
MHPQHGAWMNFKRALNVKGQGDKGLYQFFTRWIPQKVTFGYESTFIHEIVEDISVQVFNDHTYLNVAKYPIGIDSRVRDINNLLGVEEIESDVRTVGICGNGGIGKSTVAKAVYNSNAQKFEGSCFVATVGEISKAPGGLVQLQKTVLSEILGEKDLEVTNVDKGINMIKRRLRDKRVLIILDDVNQLDQLNNLAGGSAWFGPGSRIIITSRDKHLLMAHQVDRIYEVKGLNNDEALQLFSWNASPKSRLSSDYEELANKAVHSAQGLPSALVLLGSLLCGKHLDQWQTVLSVLDNKKRVSNKKILEDLKITYIALEEWKTVLGVLDSYKRVPSIKIEDPVFEELLKKPVLNIEETRIWMPDMMKAVMGEEPHNYRMATSTAWIFLLTNVGLEISSAMFDQFSSASNKPHSALISMVLAILAVIISIWELIHKGIKERVKYRRQLGMFGWFYSRSGTGNKIFGSVYLTCVVYLVASLNGFTQQFSMFASFGILRILTKYTSGLSYSSYAWVLQGYTGTKETRPKN